MSKRAVAWVVGVALVSLVLPGASPAEKMASQYKINLDQDVCLAMNRAAEFLVKCQKPGKKGTVGWSWVVGEGPNAKNVAGLAALGLLQAHEVSGQDGYLESARNYAKGLVSQLEGRSPKQLPYKADIEFLARLSKIDGNDSYLQAAGKMMALIQKRSPTGAQEVNRIAVGRKGEPSLLGFDVALGIRAADAAGERRYALELADEVVRRIPAWYNLKKNKRFSLISGGALALALERLDAGHYRKTIDRFRRDLARLQGENGSWVSNETQVSAYAVMALLDSGLSKERQAAESGIRWLKSTMLKQGSFASFNDYMPEPFVGQVISEVNAEALSALAGACGLK